MKYYAIQHLPTWSEEIPRYRQAKYKNGKIYILIQCIVSLIALELQ